MRVTRSKLAETVAQQLLAELRDKRPAPGSKIPSERELMAALGVGRSTIREAINGLAMLGVLEIRHGQGAFVLDPDPSLAIGAALAGILADQSLETAIVVLGLGGATASAIAAALLVPRIDSSAAPPAELAPTGT